jgi:putative ABC transport system permease protein
MKLFMSAAIALKALRTNTMRTALAMLGIIIGVGAFIASGAIGAGAQRSIASQIQSLGSNLIIVTSGSIAQGGVRLGAGSQLTITEEDAAAIARDVPAVLVAAPSMRGNTQVVSNNQNWQTSIQGVTPDYEIAREWSIADGKFFGQTIQTNLFGDVDPLGQIIRIKKVPFTIVGVLNKKGQNAWGQDQDDVVVIPISTAKKKVIGVNQANARAVHAISVKVRQGEDMAQALESIRDVLRQRHRLQPQQDDDFTLRNLSEVLKTQEESAAIMTNLLYAVATVSLLVGGIGIMNIMLVSVTERTREIGLRMAVGARGRDILSQFLIEAVCLALIGGGVGVGLGIMSDRALLYWNWNTVIEPGAIPLSLAFASVVGVFFGFYPAWKASRLDPIEALRYE